MVQLPNQHPLVTASPRLTGLNCVIAHRAHRHHLVECPCDLVYTLAQSFPAVSDHPGYLSRRVHPDRIPERTDPTLKLKHLDADIHLVDHPGTNRQQYTLCLVYQELLDYQQ